MPRKTSRYGWIPDLPDQRDRLYAPPPMAAEALPERVDLRRDCPPVYDQGELGSCTANAIAAAFEFDQMKERLPSIFTPSRLFIYYNERAMEGTVSIDAGAQIRDGIKSVAAQGAPPESLWPYDVAKFAQQPPPSVYAAALQSTALLYFRLNQRADVLKGCLASGYPFVFGFTVYEGFEGQEVASTGHAGMPTFGESVIGGHAVLAVGYDDPDGWFLVRNSWGQTWGLEGYFTLPYAYVLSASLARDFWTVRVVR